MKTPNVLKVYSSSLKAAHSIKSPVFRGATRGFKQSRAITRDPAWMKPIVLMVHPNPMRGNNCRTRIGNKMPPVTVPHDVIPITRDRRLWK